MSIDLVTQGITSFKAGAWLRLYIPLRLYFALLAFGAGLILAVSLAIVGVCFEVVWKR